jgi:sialate O-acetylesterase
MRHLLLPFAAFLLAIAQVARGDVSLNNMFGDHMVLQQGIKNRIWGKAEPGEAVTVTLSGQKPQATVAAADGGWEVFLEPVQEYGGPHTLTVKGKNELAFQDVLVGEVWICSGQSNMQWSVNQSNDADIEKAAANFPDIRLISVPQVGTQEPKSNFEGRWSVCSPATVGEFSAVGYFFGRQLNQTLGVPVGLIDNAWGGSAAEAWVKRDKLAAHPTLAVIHEKWVKEETNFEQAKAAFEKKLADWKAAAEKAKAEGKPAPGGKPDPRQHPAGRMKGNARPGNIHSGVLTPSIGYGIKGAIWYQGESNAGRAYQYRELFPFMIKTWREEWGLGDFPFYWVQLADYKKEQTAPAESDWAELREAQTMTMKALPGTGQAVIIDLGEGKDIHPMNKQDVAKRLARWALAETYKVPSITCRSPLYKSMEKDGGKIVLSFDHVSGEGRGWRPFDVNEPVGFTIAGIDRTFVAAEAKIRDDGRIEVWSDAVADPVAVRYAWADNPVCNMYSASGLPLTPFRTDDYPGVTAEAK